MTKAVVDGHAGASVCILKCGVPTAAKPQTHGLRTPPQSAAAKGSRATSPVGTNVARGVEAAAVAVPPRVSLVATVRVVDRREVVLHPSAGSSVLAGGGTLIVVSLSLGPGGATRPLAEVVNSQLTSRPRSW